MSFAAITNAFATVTSPAVTNALDDTTNTPSALVELTADELGFVSGGADSATQLPVTKW